MNQTYEMENFKVSNNDSVVKACDHRFRLTITGATVISKQDFPDIPMASFNFKDFGEVLDGKYRPDLVVGEYFASMIPFTFQFIRFLIYVFSNHKMSLEPFKM